MVGEIIRKIGLAPEIFPPEREIVHFPPDLKIEIPPLQDPPFNPTPDRLPFLIPPAHPFTPVPLPPHFPEKQRDVEIPRSRDPNDKLRPIGFGASAFLAFDNEIAYTVRFENQSDATGPAREVVITDTLDPNLDLDTLELTEIAFANQRLALPQGLRSYQEEVSFQANGQTLQVDVLVDLDRATRTVTLTLRVIDPETGWAPEDPFLGLLYPEDGTGRGQGSISYRVKPLPDLSSGTRIENQARIYFDFNDPIDTPLVFNTLDAGTPTSRVQPLPAVTENREFIVTWSGLDETNGSGVASYDVFLSIDGRDPFLILDDTTDTFVTLVGEYGHTYSFFTIATDNVGHVEGTPSTPDATILLRAPNEAPVLTPIGDQYLNEGNTKTFHPSATDPNAADTLTYSLDAGAPDWVTIDPNTGAVTATAPLGSPAAVTITIRVTDNGTPEMNDFETITLHINRTPTDVTLSNHQIGEHSAVDTIFAELAGTDPDAGNTLSYSLVSGDGDAGNAFFAIEGNRLKTRAAFDFEAHASHSIRVLVTDQDGLALEKVFTIDVLDENDPPTDLSLDRATVAENSSNGTVVGKLTTADQDVADTFTYTLVDNAGNRFVLVGNELRVADGSLLDFERTATHTIRVRTTDAGGLWMEKEFVVTINDQNESPTSLTLTGTSVAENSPGGTVVGVLSGTDPDAGDTLSYTLVDNAGGRFVLVGNELRVADSSLLDFERNTTHTIRVRTTDSGGLWMEKEFVVTVTDQNEAPTSLTLTGTSVAENSPGGTVVGVLSGTDPDAGDTLSYTLVDNAGGRFVLVGNELRVADGSLLDFERNATHTIRVRMTDRRGLTLERFFNILVTNADESPTDLLLNGQTISENSANGTRVGTLGTVDPDATDSFQYLLLESADDRFALVGNEIRVADGTRLNFERDSAHLIRIRSTDRAGHSIERLFRISVLDMNEPPTGLSLSRSAILEHSPVGTVVGKFATIDPDRSDRFTYVLLDNAGGRFRVVGDQLQVANREIVDFERNQSHTIRVRTIDKGGISIERSFLITVLNRNEKPSIDLKNHRLTDPNRPVYTILRNGRFVFDLPNGTGIQCWDSDAGASLLPLRMTITATTGTLTLASRIGLRKVNDNGTSQVVIEGTAWAITNALNGLLFKSPAAFAGWSMISFSLNDLGNTGAGSPLTEIKSVVIRINNLAPRFPMIGLPAFFRFTVPSGATELVVQSKDGLIRGVRDRNGDALTVTVTVPPAAAVGTLSLDADGGFRLKRNANFHGLTSFKFRYFDGRAYSEDITVTLDIA